MFFSNRDDKAQVGGDDFVFGGDGVVPVLLDKVQRTLLGMIDVYCISNSGRHELLEVHFSEQMPFLQGRQKRD